MADPTALAALGPSDVRVTRLGVGTAPLAGLFRVVDEEEALAALTRAWELGLKLFDTAPLYGAGLAEQRLGAAVARVSRDEAVVSTKVGRVLEPGRNAEFEASWGGTPAFHPKFDFSESGIMRSYSESLGRLGLQRVDVLHIHDPDDHWDEAIGEAYPALRRLRDRGVVGAIGVGMNQPEMLTRFAASAAFDCFLVAGRYTLLDQSALPQLLPACQHRGISVIIGGVFNSGVLADPSPAAHYDYQPPPPALLDRVRRIEKVCETHGVPLAAAAVQFPLGHPAVASVLVGVRSMAEVEKDVELFQWPIPDELWERLKADGLLPRDVPVPVADQ